jgi:hypothetical protein
MKPDEFSCFPGFELIVLGLKPSRSDTEWDSNKSPLMYARQVTFKEMDSRFAVQSTGRTDENPVSFSTSQELNWVLKSHLYVHWECLIIKTQKCHQLSLIS